MRQTCNGPLLDEPATEGDAKNPERPGGLSGLTREFRDKY